jgi:hypothetical protein
VMVMAEVSELVSRPLPGENDGNDRTVLGHCAKCAINRRGPQPWHHCSRGCEDLRGGEGPLSAAQGALNGCSLPCDTFHGLIDNALSIRPVAFRARLHYRDNKEACLARLARTARYLIPI